MNGTQQGASVAVGPEKGETRLHDVDGHSKIFWQILPIVSLLCHREGQMFS